MDNINSGVQTFDWYSAIGIFSSNNLNFRNITTYKASSYNSGFYYIVLSTNILDANSTYSNNEAMFGGVYFFSICTDVTLMGNTYKNNFA